MAGTFDALALHSKFISDVLMLNLQQLLFVDGDRLPRQTSPLESIKAHWLLL
jgi:hypothetical protein